MNLDKWSYWLSLLISASLIIIPFVLPICSVSAKPMRCFFAFQTEFLLALLAVVTALSLFFTKESESKSVSGFFLSLIGIVIFVLPFQWVIGICGHGESPCQLTAGFTRALSVLLMFTGAFIAWRKNTVQNKEITK